MHPFRVASAVTALAIAQAAGSFVGGFAPAAAQSDEVVVLVGEKGRDACEVRFKQSDDGEHWGDQTVIRSWEACAGGIVTAYVTTQAEVSSIQAAAAGSTSQEVRTVPVTGDAAGDQAAVDAEIDAIHQTFAGGTLTPASEEGALAPNTTLGFAAPGTFDADAAAAAAPAAATCTSGYVGQKRRAELQWKQKAIGVYVKSFVYYRRVSCAQWRITDINSILLNPYRDRIWLHDVEYTRYYYPSGNNYGYAQSGPICRQLYQDHYESYPLGWDIQAGGQIELESVDTNPNSPAKYWSCTWGAGTSATSAWTTLYGGSR